MLLLGEKRRHGQGGASAWPSTLAGLLLAVGAAAAGARARTRPARSRVYLPGNWPVPFGIVLVVDRLSALMMVLAGSVGLAVAAVRAGALAPRRRALPSAVPAAADGPVRRLPHRRPVQPVRLLRGAAGRLATGCCCTAAAPSACAPGLHYIAINLMASLLFLIGVALLYGVTGTLNMADIAQKLPQVPASDRGLLHAGAAILGDRLPRQGRAVAAELLAAAGLRRGRRAGGGAVRDPHQGRRLRGAAPVDAVLSGQRGRARRCSAPTCWSGAGSRRWPSARSACWPRSGSSRLAGFSIIASSGTLLAAIGFDVPALTGRRAVLPGQLDAGRRRAVPAGRADGARAPGRGRAAPDDDGDDQLPFFVGRRAAAATSTSTTRSRR